jgi:hypothetical protein
MEDGMTDREILGWLHRIAQSAKYALEDGEPIYLEKTVVALEHEMRELVKKEAQEPKP